MNKYNIDDKILEQEDEKEFGDRKKIFKKIYDAMDSEIIMKESLPCIKLNDNRANIIQFPVMDKLNHYRTVNMNIQTIRINSGISKKMMEINDQDKINSRLIHLGERVAYEFNSAILKAIVNYSDRKNDITIGNNILMQDDLIECSNKIKSAEYSPTEIIMFSNTSNEQFHGICAAIRLKYRSDQFCYDNLNNKHPTLMIYDYEKAGIIGIGSLTLKYFEEKIIENLNTMQACLRFGISILNPDAISVLISE